jgi:hypothetical protein
MVVLSIVLANWLPNFVETLGNSNVGFPLLWAKYRKLIAATLLNGS